jgi:hypothetical protein
MKINILRTDTSVEIVDVDLPAFAEMYHDDGGITVWKLHEDGKTVTSLSERRSGWEVEQETWTSARDLAMFVRDGSLSTVSAEGIFEQVAERFRHWLSKVIP